jgi:hypothetical protein
VPVSTLHKLLDTQPHLADITTIVYVDDTHALAKTDTLDITAALCADFFETSSAASTSSGESQIEVERKFKVEDTELSSLQQRICEQGGKMVRHLA